MPSARDDYLLRLLHQVAEMLRQLRARLGGGAAAAELLPAIRAAEGELLGPRAALLRSLDARTAAHLVGGSEAAQLWAELLRLEAAVLRQDGDEERARQAEARAAALEQHAGSA